MKDLIVATEAFLRALASHDFGTGRMSIFEEHDRREKLKAARQAMAEAVETTPDCPLRDAAEAYLSAPPAQYEPRWRELREALKAATREGEDR